MVLRLNWIGAVAWACVLMFAASASPQTIHEPTSKQTEALKTFLQHYLGKPDPSLEQEWASRYSSAFVDLSDNGTTNVIVYVSGRGWCGTGGCALLVLAPEGASYRVVTETTITRPPIRVLATESNGWHDISVVVAGGGIQPGYEAKLSFDGKTYPSNPSVLPARPLRNKVRGKIVLSATAKDKPLYLPDAEFPKVPEQKPKFIGTETIMPGEAIGSLRLGMKKDELTVSWQAKPDLTHSEEDSCKGTELDWFDNENSSPGVVAYVADERVYEITSKWDERFNIHGMRKIFGMTLKDLKAAMPSGELLRLKGSAWRWPSQTDELFWVVSSRGIAFGLAYPLELRSPAGERIVQSITVFEPREKFQPEGCLNPDHPLVPVKMSAND